MSNVNFNEFLQRFTEELDINLDNITEIKLSDIPEYDSIGIINISLLIEELFDFQIEHEDLNTASSVEELYNICLRNKK
tara:strand:- start:460 stop:696 length:237 start_codon:yes stop_codon:yes gene_type:complete